MKKLRDILEKASQMPGKITEDHVGAYAAQSAYFFMLCMIPIILLFLTMVQFTPITKADVMTAVIQVFPSSVDSMITSIVNQVYNQSTGIIPVTLIVTLWSAGKGVLAMTTGLNCIFDCRETRNYVLLRIRATLYTIMFIVVILLLLVLSVFGNSLNLFVLEHVPFMSGIADWLIEARTIISPAVLVVFCLLIYTFLPNRKAKMLRQLPGAAFAALGWMIVSWIFSVYLDIFKGFSSMYGSLTTIVLIMLWMYFCMYSILLGGEVNVLLYQYNVFKQDSQKGEGK
ncbi:MAG: YihY/virulence factor BrkB family protein [Lachnospiraceae bacterium]